MTKTNQPVLIVVLLVIIMFHPSVPFRVALAPRWFLTRLQMQGQDFFRYTNFSLSALTLLSIFCTHTTHHLSHHLPPGAFTFLRNNTKSNTTQSIFWKQKVGNHQPGRDSNWTLNWIETSEFLTSALTGKARLCKMLMSNDRVSGINQGWEIGHWTK